MSARTSNVPSARPKIRVPPLVTANAVTSFRAASVPTTRPLPSASVTASVIPVARDGRVPSDGSGCVRRSNEGPQG